MFINIDKLLIDQDKSRYWLAKELGMTYQNVMRLCNNETVSIKFELIEKICKALNCTPNDIFDISQ